MTTTEIDTLTCEVCGCVDADLDVFAQPRLCGGKVATECEACQEEHVTECNVCSGSDD